MKNRGLAERAYVDYKVYLQKKGELLEKLQSLETDVKAAENTDERLQIYDEMNRIREELDDIKIHIDALARMIVEYIFG